MAAPRELLITLRFSRRDRNPDAQTEHPRRDWPIDSSQAAGTVLLQTQCCGADHRLDHRDSQPTTLSNQQTVDQGSRYHRDAGVGDDSLWLLSGTKEDKCHRDDHYRSCQMAQHDGQV